MPPKVSVVLPAYNAEGSIIRAIESARIQNYQALELLVVDDASADATCALVERCGMDGLKLLRHTKNQGAAAARNTAIDAARGEYIAFLDADDVWLPGKLAMQIDVLDRNPRASIVTCDCEIRNEAGAVLKRTHAANPPVSGPAAWKNLLAANFIPTPTVVARRKAILDAGGFDPALPVAEDLDLWIRLALAGEIAVLREVLVHVYDRPGSLMKRHDALEQQILFSLLDRYFEGQRHRLSAREIRAIRGRRCFQLGAKYLQHHYYSASCPLFWRSALSGHRPAKSIVNVARAFAGRLLHHGAGAPQQCPPDIEFRIPQNLSCE